MTSCLRATAPALQVMLGIVLVLEYPLPATRRIVAKGNLTEKQAADYFRTMVTVAAHCHQLGVMHR